jgi:hypothetical protein
MNWRSDIIIAARGCLKGALWRLLAAIGGGGLGGCQAKHAMPAISHVIYTSNASAILSELQWPVAAFIRDLLFTAETRRRKGNAHKTRCSSRLRAFAPLR